jgi:signal transduction histidine kinase
MRFGRRLADLTERQRVEETVQESQRFAQETIDALSAHLCVLDESGTVIAVNKSWRAFAEANQLGLADAALGANYLAVFTQRTGLQTTFSAQGCKDRLPTDAETVVYRFVQEALTNVGRHAQATHVAVAVRRSKSVVVAEVRDDGKGFDPQQITPDRGSGLLGMRERATLAGGDFHVASQVGQGTCVSIEIPVAAARLGLHRG